MKTRTPEHAKLRFIDILQALTPKFTQYNMSSSLLLQGSEKIDENYAGQNRTVRFFQIELS
jgi:hypothetical protein